MTPTFQAVANEMLKPLKERRLNDRLGIARRLPEFHFFDVSAVAEMAHELGNKMAVAGPSERMAFLPAKCTALDFRGSGLVGGIGILMEETGDHANCWMVASDDNGRRSITEKSFRIGLREKASKYFTHNFDDPNGAAMAGAWAPVIYGALALINTPRIVGRRQRMPHAGLQRKLAASRGMVGKFPLHAWTEIVLEVRPPEVAGEQVHEAHLTGGKCLHFCRAHLRIRNGYLEYVSPHWRGDPALGIKQTRYRLAA